MGKTLSNEELTARLEALEAKVAGQAKPKPKEARPKAAEKR